jgi:hypothetical protein
MAATVWRSISLQMCALWGWIHLNLYQSFFGLGCRWLSEKRLGAIPTFALIQTVSPFTTVPLGDGIPLLKPCQRLLQAAKCSHDRRRWNSVPWKSKWRNSLWLLSQQCH